MLSIQDARAIFEPVIETCLEKYHTYSRMTFFEKMYKKILGDNIPTESQYEAANAFKKKMRQIDNTAALIEETKNYYQAFPELISCAVLSAGFTDSHFEHLDLKKRAEGKWVVLAIHDLYKIILGFDVKYAEKDYGQTYLKQLDNEIYQGFGELHSLHQ